MGRPPPHISICPPEGGKGPGAKQRVGGSTKLPKVPATRGSRTFGSEPFPPPPTPPASGTPPVGGRESLRRPPPHISICPPEGGKGPGAKQRVGGKTKLPTARHAALAPLGSEPFPLPPPGGENRFVPGGNSLHRTTSRNPCHVVVGHAHWGACRGPRTNQWRLNGPASCGKPPRWRNAVFGYNSGVTRSGARFRRQAPIGPYIVDFVCHAARLVVEVDGEWHAWSYQDVERMRYLRSRGYRVLRFTNRERRDRIGECGRHHRPTPRGSRPRNVSRGGRAVRPRI